jgi:hypothetical protein
MPSAKKPSARKKMLKNGETGKGRRDDLMMARVLGEMWGVELFFPPWRFKPANFIAVRAFDFKTVAYIDLAYRDCSQKTFENFHAGKERLDRAIYLAAQNGFRYILCVRFTNGLFAAEIDQPILSTFESKYIQINYSTKKIYEIPMSLFKKAAEIEF